MRSEVAAARALSDELVEVAVKHMFSQRAMKLQCLEHGCDTL